MIEYPEAKTIARQLNETLTGQEVCGVLPRIKEHKFLWLSGTLEEYEARTTGRTVVGADSFGCWVRLSLSGGVGYCFTDGILLRLVNQRPNNYNFALQLSAGYLACSVAMYGGIYLVDEGFDNPYYLTNLKGVDICTEAFWEYFNAQASLCTNMSAKAFLATQQRFCGIGNGVAQDILFNARINPRQRMGALSQGELDGLATAMRDTVSKMTAQGGRDTEKDLMGNAGGYMTVMSKNNLAGCPVCGSSIVKEQYLGGTVYYCPSCQQLK